MIRLNRNALSLALASVVLVGGNAAHAQAAATPVAQDTADAQAVAAAKKKAEEDAAARAQAQTDTADPSATNLETVNVTGIRRGIEAAIEVKKNSTSIVEAISAEDIGKLPDVSIAESIARMPGVTAQRVGGRAQVISVRGLSPDFATTLLNGREVVSTGDNRSVEFDQFPSELINGVTLYKTPDAALVGQGLSGTIDMLSVRPLSFAGPVATVSGRYQKNSLGSGANYDGDGNRLTASYIDQYADRTIGLSIGYAHSELPIQENQVGLYEPWQQVNTPGIPETPTTPGVDPGPVRPGVPVGAYYSDGIKALRRTGLLERDAVMATLQYRPSNAWTSTLDMFYTQAEQTDTANQFEVNLSDYPSGLLVTNPQVNGNNTFVGGVANNVYPLVRGMYNTREDKIWVGGWNNVFAVGQATMVADVSYSKAKRDELNLENNSQLQPNPSLDDVDLSYTGNGFSQLHPGLDYSNPNDLYLTNTIYGSGYGKTPKVEDTLGSVRLSAAIPIAAATSWLADLSFGLNYADREKQKRQPEGNINLGDQGDTTIAQDLQYDPVNLGFAGVGWIPAWNVPGAVGRYMTFAPTEDLSYLIPKAWTVREKIFTGYVQANIDANLGSVPVRGNVGVQVVNVDQSSQANYYDSSQPAGSNIQPLDAGKTYTDVLPSMNLAFMFSHDQTLRVALAKQVARPRIDQLRASLEFGVNELGRPGGAGGNPLLDPWEANAFDISYEKYFGDKAYVAAAYYYKDLKTYIYTQKRDNYDFSSLLVDYVPPAGSPPVQDIGDFTSPQNGKGGMLQGIELTASIPLDLFTESLRGFGFVASATFNDSDITVFDPESATSVGDGPIPLPGLSDRIYNVTAYYERNGFEARISQRYRSDFIGEIGNFSGVRTLRYVEGEDITDAQISYAFGKESRYAGLSFLLQASNLTNSAYRTYAGTKDRPLEHVEWGRTYMFGLSYSY